MNPRTLRIKVNQRAPVTCKNYRYLDCRPDRRCWRQAAAARAAAAGSSRGHPSADPSRRLTARQYAPASPAADSRWQGRLPSPRRDGCTPRFDAPPVAIQIHIKLYYNDVKVQDRGDET